MKIVKEAEKSGIPYEKKGRVLVWHDEFDGGKINTENWMFEPTMGAGDRIYTNDEKHARVENDKLVLRSFRSENDPHIFSLSEGLTTRLGMNFKYGYVEMRAKVPFRRGAWPSFWMLSGTPFAKASYKGEIDIFEVFGHETQIMPATHKWEEGKHAATPRELFEGKDILYFDDTKTANEYHIYSLEWDKKELKFAIDGEVYTSLSIEAGKGDFGDDEIPGLEGFHDFYYLIMNNEMLTEGGWYLHSPESRVKDEDSFPIEYTIDYIRLYQRQGEEIKFAEEIAEAQK